MPIKTAKTYLEYGSGGSTFLALIYSNAKIYSVESDPNWLKHLRTYKIIHHNEISSRLHFKHINIGKTVEWGFPLNDNLRNNYPQYSTAILQQLHDENIDFVFIDGRFRVACALAVVSHVQPSTYIAIHDYTFRPEYHIVEEFLDIIHTQDSLVVFKPKSNYSQKHLVQLYEEYKFITD